MKPIAVQDPCLGCHGSEEQIDDGVRRVLEARYPQDEATGYEQGDLRGALWVVGDVP